MREGDLPGHIEVSVRRVTGHDDEATSDAVVVEHYLSVQLALTGGVRPLATLACTPEHLEELTAGYLIGQGLVSPGSSPREVRFRCSLSPDKRVATVSVDVAGDRGGSSEVVDKLVASGCGAGMVFSQARALLDLPFILNDMLVDSAYLSALAAALQDAPLFRLTGGSHSALAAKAERFSYEEKDWGSAAEANTLVRREDIGRHNAVDKVIGHLWLAENLGQAEVLVTSGRISSDIVIKAARAGIPFVVSHGAPTSLAISLAQETGLTLAGFARGRRLNLYGLGGGVLTSPPSDGPGKQE